MRIKHAISEPWTSTMAASVAQHSSALPGLVLRRYKWHCTITDLMATFVQSCSGNALRVSLSAFATIHATLTTVKTGQVNSGRTTLPHPVQLSSGVAGVVDSFPLRPALLALSMGGCVVLLLDFCSQKSRVNFQSIEKTTPRTFVSFSTDDT